jgi:putative serine protease PepD
VAAVASLFVAYLALRPAASLNVENAALSIVQIAALDCGWTGSGSLVTDSGLVLTNSHVATDEGVDRCNLLVAFTDNYESEPDDWYSAEVIVDDVALDLAVIQLLDESGNPTPATGRSPIPLDTTSPSPGDEIQILGYPGAGGSTMTFTSGDFAGVDGADGEQYYKTTASMNPGVSGGAAFKGSFALIGVPSAGSTVDVDCDQGDCTAFGNSIGFIRPIRYAEPLIERAVEIMDNR